MKVRILIFLLGCCAAGYGQFSTKTTGYLQGQYNHTLYDQTKGNNPWGMGVGALVFIQSKSSIGMAAELTADHVFVDDKVFRMYSDGTGIPAVAGTVNLFAGLVYRPVKRIALTLTGGPSFVSGGVFAGIKPSLLVYLSKNQKWMTRIAYVNVFNRDKRTRQDFGVLSAGVGLRLF